MKKTIAIDFDGCLCECAWPGIGAPHMEVINAAIRERESGAALILWTCRIGERLDEAVAWCAGFGLVFDAVNDNLPESIAAFKADPRKVFADEYWDDRAVHMPLKVVLCKDCKHLYFKDFSAFCPHRVSACKPDGFCEYGERRKPKEGELNAAVELHNES